MASKLTPHEYILLNRSAARPFRITHSRSAEKAETSRSGNCIDALIVISCRPKTGVHFRVQT
jgi:hypothetical protein